MVHFIAKDSTLNHFYEFHIISFFSDISTKIMSPCKNLLNDITVLMTLLKLKYLCSFDSFKQDPKKKQIPLLCDLTTRST